MYLYNYNVMAFINILELQVKDLPKGHLIRRLENVKCMLGHNLFQRH